MSRAVVTGVVRAAVVIGITPSRVSVRVLVPR